MTKTCTKCATEKPVAEFHRRGPTGRVAWCKACHRDYYREKVKADRGYFAKYQYRSRAKKRAAVSAIRVLAGCADCGEKHPACLEHHHSDPSVKVSEVATLADQNAAWERINAEIAKCIVLCANCHRKRHFTERAAEKAARSA